MKEQNSRPFRASLRILLAPINVGESNTTIYKTRSLIKCTARTITVAGDVTSCAVTYSKRQKVRQIDQRE